MRGDTEETEKIITEKAKTEPDQERTRVRPVSEDREDRGLGSKVNTRDSFYKAPL